MPTDPARSTPTEGAARQRIPRPRRQDVRRHLLVAARTLFAEHGYAGTSLDMIAAHAGYTKGAIYSNFETKERLLGALMEETIQERLAITREALNNHPADVDPIQHLGNLLLRAANDDDDWQLLFIEFWMTAVRNPALRADFAAFRSQLVELIAGEIDAIAASHPITDFTSTELAVVILGLSNGLGIEYLTEPDNVPPDLLGKVFTKLAP